jgi:hypothetical protein
MPTTQAPAHWSQWATQHRAQKVPCGTTLKTVVPMCMHLDTWIDASPAVVPGNMVGYGLDGNITLNEDARINYANGVKHNKQRVR